MVGRCVPTIRTLISIPAGIFEMPLRTFVPLTLLGVTFWNAALAWIGYELGGDYRIIDRYLGPVSIGIVILMIVIYLYRLMTFSKHAA